MPAEQRLAAAVAEKLRAQHEAERDRDRQQAEGDETGGSRNEPRNGRGAIIPAGTGDVRVVACDVAAPACTTTRWVFPFLSVTTTAPGIGCDAGVGCGRVHARQGEHGEQRPGRENGRPDVAHLSPPARPAGDGAGAAGVIVWPICGAAGEAGTVRVSPATAAAPVSTVAASTAARANSSRRLGVRPPGRIPTVAATTHLPVTMLTLGDGRQPCFTSSSPGEAQATSVSLRTPAWGFPA